MKWSRKTLDREDGAVLIITAFIFLALVGVAALVIDIVVIHQARLKAQATADSAVLAAAYDLGDIGAATAAGKDYAFRNYDVDDGDWAGCFDADALAVATTVPCISVDDADAPSLIRIRIPDRTVPAFFSTVMGHDGFQISASAIAQVEYVTVSPGTSGPGVDPDEPSVRDGDTGGWKTTGTDEGCPAGWYDDHPPDGDTEDPEDDGKKKKGGGAGGNEWREYIFVFEHIDGSILVWCDTNKNDKFVG